MCMPVQEDLAVALLGERVDQRRPPGAQRLDLGAGQRHARPRTCRGWRSRGAPCGSRRRPCGPSRAAWHLLAIAAAAGNAIQPDASANAMHQQRQAGQPVQRVDRRAVEAHLEVQVVAGRGAGGADPADHLAAAHLLARPAPGSATGARSRCDSPSPLVAAVVDAGVVAVPAVPAGPDHPPVGRRADRRARRRRRCPPRRAAARRGRTGRSACRSRWTSSRAPASRKPGAGPQHGPGARPPWRASQARSSASTRAASPAPRRYRASSAARSCRGDRAAPRARCSASAGHARPRPPRPAACGGLAPRPAPARPRGAAASAARAGPARRPVLRLLGDPAGRS